MGQTFEERQGTTKSYLERAFENNYLVLNEEQQTYFKIAAVFQLYNGNPERNAVYYTCALIQHYTIDRQKIHGDNCVISTQPLPKYLEGAKVISSIGKSEEYKRVMREDSIYQLIGNTAYKYIRMYSTSFTKSKGFDYVKSLRDGKVFHEGEVKTIPQIVKLVEVKEPEYVANYLVESTHTPTLDLKGIEEEVENEVPPKKRRRRGKKIASSDLFKTKVTEDCLNDSPHGFQIDNDYEG